jgi:hypothetical protein
MKRTRDVLLLKLIKINEILLEIGALTKYERAILRTEASLWPGFLVNTSITLVKLPVKTILLQVG